MQRFRHSIATTLASLAVVVAGCDTHDVIRRGVASGGSESPSPDETPRAILFDGFENYSTTTRRFAASKRPQGSTPNASSRGGESPTPAGSISMIRP